LFPELDAPRVDAAVLRIRELTAVEVIGRDSEQVNNNFWQVSPKKAPAATALPSRSDVWLGSIRNNARKGCR
jgi:hypothetical protein